MTFTQPEKAFCVFAFTKNEPPTVIERAFRRKYGKAPPEKKTIVRWHGRYTARQMYRTISAA